MGKDINKKFSIKELERWKLFYNLTKEVYDREANRYVRIEEKALHCLTSFSLILAVYSFLWKHILDNTIPPECVAEIILSVLSVLLLIFFIFSWLIIFRTFETSKIKVMPMHEDMVKYFEHRSKGKKISRNLAELYYDLGEINKEAYENNCKITEEEIRRFKLGIKMMQFSAIALIIFIAMYATYLWCRCSIAF